MRLLPAIVCRIKGMPNSGILALLPLVCHTAIAILGILVRDGSWRNTTISEISSIHARITHDFIRRITHDLILSARCWGFAFIFYVYLYTLCGYLSGKQQTATKNILLYHLLHFPAASRAEMRYLGRKIIAVTSSAVRAILAEEENVTCEFFMKLPFLWSMKTKFLQ